MTGYPILERKFTAGIDALSPDGSFSGHASLFDRVDLGRDRVRRGAFAASLAKRGVSGIRMLWQHDPAEPIGVWHSIEEDEDGLFVRGHLAPDAARSRDALALLRQGAIDGLSIGFKTARSRVDKSTGIRDLVEIDLWEISLVTFPMLPEARVTGLKGRRLPDGARLESVLRSAARQLRQSS
jgi:uncharacterized protein